MHTTTRVLSLSLLSFLSFFNSILFYFHESSIFLSFKWDTDGVGGTKWNASGLGNFEFPFRVILLGHFVGETFLLGWSHRSGNILPSPVGRQRTGCQDSGGWRGAHIFT